LNEFQKLMRRWAKLGPYNAGHVMRVTGVADVERWRAAVEPVLREITQDETAEFSITTSVLELDRKIEEELNRPFSPAECPLRFFLIANGDADYFLGVIFDHWFADSASMRLLMERFFLSYQNRETRLPIEMASAETSAIFGGNKNKAGGFAALRACLRSYFRHRRAYRVRLQNPLDFRAEFFSLQFPEGAIDRVREAAKKCGTTVNDFFLAAAAQVLGAYTAAARLHARRNRVGLATVVDLRPFAPGKLDKVFGFFLSYFTVVLQSPERRPLATLAKEIAHETSSLKSKAHPIRFILGLRIARKIWDTFREPRRQAQLFSKMLPLLAGISNVNLTGAWMDEDKVVETGPRVIDYLRVSPVGPLLPFVFTLTTIRGRLSLCVAYRTTAFTRAQAQHIAHDFATLLLDIE
jgi:NRPS condensation-like uncharacterized protein